MLPFDSKMKPEMPDSALLGAPEASASPLLVKLLTHPFARLRSRHRSVDIFDYDSDAYVGLRMIDQVVDFETRERGCVTGHQAQSVAELRGSL